MLGEQYRKEPDGKTYMMLPKKEETFEEAMIRNTMPEGILSMVKSEEECYKYEITGKKTLAMTFERVPMNAEQIEQILKGILTILERGKEFLLTEDNFVLQPEYIFLRVPAYEVTLCYYPGYRVPFPEQMGKLFEVFLNRVDYREARAIEMVYAWYMQLQEPDMTVERLRENLLLQKKSVVEDKSPVPVREEKKTDNFSVIETEAILLKEKEPGVKKEIKRKGLWERLRKEIGNRRGKATEEKAVGDVYPSIPAPVAPCVMEPVPEWGTQYTTVLSVKHPEARPSLVSKRTGEQVFLTKFPFYVGSLPEYMDYVIKEETVSRFHGKFVKKGEEIYLTDLNSTNGTQVNGRVLEVQEQVKLEEGDRVLFADEEYTYFAGEKTAK